MDVPYREFDLSTRVVYRQIPMLDPDKILAYLWDVVGIQVQQESIDAYWEDAIANDLPWARDLANVHPKPIPLKLFGDDCSYNLLGDKCLAWILSCPLWRPKSARNSRWPTAIIGLKNSLGSLTMRPILMRLVARLNVCFDYPVTNDGHRFMVTELGGDWKYAREAFEMQSHWNSPKLCHLCSTQRDEMTELLDELPWRDLPNFCQHILPQQADWSPLVLLRHFHPTMITWCLLHTLYLGLLWTANGGALACLLELGVYGDPNDVDMRTRLRVAYQSFRAWLKRFNLTASQRVFTLKMVFKQCHGAYLSAKGFNSRLLAAWLADECKRQLDLVGNDANEELLLVTHTMWLACIFWIICTI